MGEVSLDQRLAIQNQDARLDIEPFMSRLEIFRCRNFVAIICSRSKPLQWSEFVTDLAMQSACESTQANDHQSRI